MGRVKAIQKTRPRLPTPNPTGRSLSKDDEPRYLRRQKPVEIRRKKFGGKNLGRFIAAIFYWRAERRRVSALRGYVVGNFLLHSPQMLLLKPEQIEVSGNHIVVA